MRNLATIAVVLAAGTAYGISVGAGGFYAYSLPIGEIYDSYERCMTGFGGKVMIGVKPYLNVDVGFGYHMKYKGKWGGISAGIEPPSAVVYPVPDDLDDYYLTTIPITFGVSYPMSFDAMGVYFGGGGAFVMEKFNVGESWTRPLLVDPRGFNKAAPEDVSKPGLYVGGGFKYNFTDKLALDVNPRWIMVLDAKDAVADKPDTTVDEYSPETSNSMFIDILFGVDYFFM